VAKELGKMWADVNPDVKRMYEQKAEQDKARYARDMADYKARSQMQNHQEMDDDEEEEEDDDE